MTLPATFAGPRVTVVVPAFNARSTIGKTLRSAQAQTYRNLEILVVDDGSTDDTVECVTSISPGDPRIRLIRQSNGGPSAARNAALAQASGEFVAPLDADDLWHPTKIQKQIEVFAANPGVGLVYTWSRVINLEDRVRAAKLPLFARGHVHSAMMAVNFIGGGSVPLIRTDVLREVGGYDVALRNACEDFKLQLLIAERYEYDLVPEFLVGYRWHPSQLSADFAGMLRARRVVLREACRRNPSVPRLLARLSLAHSFRITGIQMVKKGDIARGYLAMMQAAAMDPVASAHEAFDFVGRRMKGRSGPVQDGLLSAAGDESPTGLTGEPPIGRPFMEVDPYTGWDVFPESWRTNRIVQATSDPLRNEIWLNRRPFASIGEEGR